ncbi:hypothetical protein ACTHOQ_04125 [Solibacillus silvestris]|uniref:hypothetical protein n=1 Tax=Solibacillus silvestris TaxID=76853 RepID=UPI003F7DB723
MKIKPTKEILLSWMESYVPEKDLFFLSKEQLTHGIDLTGVLIMPIDEFYSHSTYGQLNYVNGYEYWNIKSAQYVIIAKKEWIESMAEGVKQFILNSQVQCGRGLVLPAAFMQEIEKIPSSYTVNGHIVIQRSMWEKLDESSKEQILATMVYEWWDNGECEKTPKFLPSFLKPFANTFDYHQGANCLAAVLYAISEGEQEWFIYEWIHQKTFLEKLKQYHYEEFLDEELHQGDIVVWQDENGIIQHAAYYIGEELYFNKHGQTMFNPWKILAKDQLYKEWVHLALVKYRQSNAAA